MKRTCKLQTERARLPVKFEARIVVLTSVSQEHESGATVNTGSLKVDSYRFENQHLESRFLLQHAADGVEIVFFLFFFSHFPH